jgi:Met-zincin
VFQGLKEVAMHEVGHTLGLRHNFKASKIYSIKEMNDPAVGKPHGIVASVMDYTPTNIATKDMPQGDFYMTTVGAYDYWAIEYGYKPLSGGTQGEIVELKKIASRSGEKELQYATDEDTTGASPDPDSNRFDMGSDPIEFALHRAKIAEEQLPTLVERLVKDGEDYSSVRRAFQNLIMLQTRAMAFAARQVGGVKSSRSHKGDKDAKPPFSLQRDVMTMLEDKVFSDKPYSLPPETWNLLGTLHWSHWGQEPPTRRDFGIHDFVLGQQLSILSSLLSPTSLTRLYDAELKASPDVDVVTGAEVIQRLTKSIFSELDTVRAGDFTNRKPAISSLRRNLQRAYFERLSDLAMRKGGAPADCQSIAFLELTNLAARIDATLKSPAKLDPYTLAHLTEMQSRIKKVLEASMTLGGGAGGGGPIFLR